MTGKDKGKEGVIMRVMPDENRVLISGVNTASKHQKARRANEKAGIIDRDMPIDASNVRLVHKGKPVRVGYRIEDDGTKVRIARPSGEVIR
jgi:large subunit ribosomal protein L24